jgi:LDH2 family malate/lactate/ureidoglycolate dehydrogenase
MAVEVLCSILGGATYGKNVRTWRETSKIADLGQCFIAIDPECFAPDFSLRLQAYLDETRGLKPVDESKAVMVAGDPERQNIARYPEGLIYGKKQLDHLVS